MNDNLINSRTKKHYTLVGTIIQYAPGHWRMKRPKATIKDRLKFGIWFALDGWLILASVFGYGIFPIIKAAVVLFGPGHI